MLIPHLREQHHDRRHHDLGFALGAAQARW
jgi:hypothetical protein